MVGSDKIQHSRIHRACQENAPSPTKTAARKRRSHQRQPSAKCRLRVARWRPRLRSSLSKARHCRASLKVQGSSTYLQMVCTSLWVDATGELDHIFVWNNVVLLCEETAGKDATKHFTNKVYLHRKISENWPSFLLTTASRTRIC